MRTTIDIDDDMLSYAKQKARTKNTSLGKVVSDALRDQVNNVPVDNSLGFPIIPRRPNGPVITPEYIQELLDESE